MGLGVVRINFLLAVMLWWSCAQAAPAAEEKPFEIYSAASLVGAMHDCAVLWVKTGHPPPVLHYGASETLAADIANGAHADVFASSSAAATDALVARGLVPRKGVHVLYGNSLVLVAPKGVAVPAAIDSHLDWDALLGPKGRLAMGDPRFVIGGAFARQALQKLGLWGKISGRTVLYPHVRAVGEAVARGEAQAGVVFASDMRLDPGLAVIGAFPASTHPPIRYQFMTTTKGDVALAAAFIAFLDSQPARDIFTQYGFTPP